MCECECETLGWDEFIVMWRIITLKSLVMPVNLFSNLLMVMNKSQYFTILELPFKSWYTYAKIALNLLYSKLRGIKGICYEI